MSLHVNKPGDAHKPARLHKKSRKKLNWRAIAFVVLLGIFLFSGSMLVVDLRRSAREQESNRLLAQQVQLAKDALLAQQAAADDGRSDTPLPVIPVPKWNEDGILTIYETLYNQNPDMAGWLSIDDTGINYPVMYTPKKPEKYLRRAFDGSYAVSGSLFIGEGGSPDASHMIVYGHRMDDGSMFGTLRLYEDEAYTQNHAIIHCDTIREGRDYEVVAAFYSQVYTDQDTGVFRYYQYNDLSDQGRFEEYVKRVRSTSLYDTGVDVQFGDRLLTLSTCSYHKENGRFVVVAREIVMDEEESEAPDTDTVT